MRWGLSAFVLVALLGGLGGCQTQAALTGEQLVLTSAQATLTSAKNALTDYGIAKGIGQAAQAGLTLAGQTVLAGGLGSLITAADARATQLQAAIDASTLDLAEIQGLVAQINALVQALRLQAAPLVTVTPTQPLPAASGAPAS